MIIVALLLTVGVLIPLIIFSVIEDDDKPIGLVLFSGLILPFVIPAYFAYRYCIKLYQIWLLV